MCVKSVYTPPVISLADIRRARKRIEKAVLRTPVLPLKVGRPDTWLKCENLQRSGSFKLRGAFNKIASLSPAERKRGVVAYSSGNHAQGVALAGQIFGIPTAIVMLDQSVAHKVEGTKSYGAEVIFGGTSSEEIKARAEAIAVERQRTLIRPFDDAFIIAGQGTIGLEIVEQVKDLKAVVVPVGGGGLSSGVATAVKSLRPRVKVFGAEPAGAPKMSESLKKGELVTLPGTNTVADGLKPVRASDITFEHVRKFVDDVVLVSDEEILAATRHLIYREKLVVEPSGAATTAAILSDKLKLPKGAVVAVISGGNVDLRLVPGLLGEVKEEKPPESGPPKPTLSLK
jgi:threonine dehydratase